MAKKKKDLNKDRERCIGEAEEKPKKLRDCNFEEFREARSQKHGQGEHS